MLIRQQKTVTSENLENKGGKPCYYPSLLLWEFPSCSAGGRKPGSLLNSLNWDVKSWDYWETKAATVIVKGYQRENSRKEKKTLGSSEAPPWIINWVLISSSVRGHCMRVGKSTKKTRERRTQLSHSTGDNA